ncbi:MAG: D-glycerate dehydrogenase [Candidatus Hydrogenedentes bacterium]|nr:D-glycerate dehydrogenase [Candidatus Hydrogenedentota bacterium]
MPKIYITRPIPVSAVRLLEETFGKDAVRMWPEDTIIPRQKLLQNVAGVDAILAILTERIDDELFDAAGPQLRIVANMAVGFDNIDVPAATRRRIPVSNTPGVLTETTADLTWALILATCRRLGESERFLRSGQWKCWSPTFMLGTDVHGKKLGIFGLGRIGQAVARRARAFGMDVMYYDPTRYEFPREAAMGVRYVEFDELLRESDILTVHCFLSPETRHAFGEAQFCAMKKSAVFINTARGPIVDEPALARALKNGDIFAAGLDVFEEEPKVHPELLACENAVLLPHIGSATEETRAKMAEMAARNIIQRLHGEVPVNCLNPEIL